MEPRGMGGRSFLPTLWDLEELGSEVGTVHKTAQTQVVSILGATGVLVVSLWHLCDLSVCFIHISSLWDVSWWHLSVLSLHKQGSPIDFGSRATLHAVHTAP